MSDLSKLSLSKASVKCEMSNGKAKASLSKLSLSKAGRKAKTKASSKQQINNSN